MQLDIAGFTELTGLSYDESVQTFYGEIQGYPVFLNRLPGLGGYVLSITCKLPPDADREYDNAEWKRWIGTQPALRILSQEHNEMLFRVKLPAADTVQRTAEAIHAAVAHAKERGMMPCCGSCGREYECAPYYHLNTGHAYCESCLPAVETESAQQQLLAKPHILQRMPCTLCSAALLFLITWLVAILPPALTAVLFLMSLKICSAGFDLVPCIGKSRWSAMLVHLLIHALACSAGAYLLCLQNERMQVSADNIFGFSAIYLFLQVMIQLFSKSGMYIAQYPTKKLDSTSE